jgi:ABC-type Fe3+/spermidine/putrescine transport system ATPase subunit
MTDALVLSDLSKTYKNGFQALKGIDLTVPEGEFYALLDQMVRVNLQRLVLLAL